MMVSHFDGLTGNGYSFTMAAATADPQPDDGSGARSPGGGRDPGPEEKGSEVKGDDVNNMNQTEP